MTPTEVAAFLRKYNVWRRGNLDDQPMPDPRQIGEAIDAAAEMIDRLEAAESNAAHQKALADSALRVAKGWEESCNALRAEIKERDALRAEVGEMEQPASSVPDGWVRAVDEALVVTHLGVASESDTYEQAREKLNNLIGWYTDVAIDPAVNGGYKLMPVEPTKESYECFAAYDGSSYSNPFDFDDFREDYLAAINSTGLPVGAKLYALPGAKGEEK